MVGLNEENEISLEKFLKYKKLSKNKFVFVYYDNDIKILNEMDSIIRKKGYSLYSLYGDCGHSRRDVIENKGYLCVICGQFNAPMVKRKINEKKKDNEKIKEENDMKEFNSDIIEDKWVGMVVLENRKWKIGEAHKSCAKKLVKNCKGEIYNFDNDLKKLLKIEDNE